MVLPDSRRVLILSEEMPETKYAGGILLHRLFMGYGGGNLGPGDFDRDHFDILTNEAGLSSSRLFVIGPKAHPEAQLLDCPYRELQMPLDRFEMSRFSMYKRSLSALGLLPLPSHRQIVRLLDGFRPEVIVCVMSDTPWIMTAARTARKLCVPLVLIVHDLNEEFEKVFPWARRALFEQNRKVYRSAARRLCVSPEMADYLWKRYGVSGEVMYPNRGEELQMLHFDRGNFDILKDGRDVLLTLGYAGSLAYGYGEALVELIPVLREVGARILISTPKPPEKLKALIEAADIVEWMPHRADINAMWREMQERADVMILPYSNPAGSHELLYRTHFPSKLTEYLALGMPVIVSGPEFATGVKWARGEGGEDFDRFNFDILNRARNGAVPCTTREKLVACLERLKKDGGMRCELARRAVEAGKRDFDPVKIREKFWKILAATADEYSAD